IQTNGGVMDVLQAEQMFKELQKDMVAGQTYSAGIKLVCTNREIRGVDGFGTSIESIDISDQASLGEKLTRIVKLLAFEKSPRGCSISKYDDYAYQANFIDMDKIVIDFPDIGQAGGTLFDLYKYNVEDLTKEKI